MKKLLNNIKICIAPLKFFYLVLFLFFISSCHDNSEKAKNKEWETIKEPCQHNIIPKDTTIELDFTKYQFSFQDNCIGEYRADTVESEKALHSYQRENEFVIKIKSKDEIIVKIKKETFASELKGEGFDKLGLGNCTFDSFDTKNKRLILLSFFGYPQTDVGTLIKYSVSFTGEIKYIGEKVPVMGMDDDLSKNSLPKNK